MQLFRQLGDKEGITIAQVGVDAAVVQFYARVVLPDDKLGNGSDVLLSQRGIGQHIVQCAAAAGAVLAPVADGGDDEIIIGRLEQGSGPHEKFTLFAQVEAHGVDLGQRLGHFGWQGRGRWQFSSDQGHRGAGLHHSYVQVLWQEVHLRHDHLFAGHHLAGQPNPTLTVPGIEIQRLVRFGVVGNRNVKGGVGCHFLPGLYPVERALYHQVGGQGLGSRDQSLAGRAHQKLGARHRREFKLEGFGRRVFDDGQLRAVGVFDRPNLPADGRESDPRDAFRQRDRRQKERRDHQRRDQDQIDQLRELPVSRRCPCFASAKQRTLFL